jgi:hypothetical protein
MISLLKINYSARLNLASITSQMVATDAMAPSTCSRSLVIPRVGAVKCVPPVSPHASVLHAKVSIRHDSRTPHRSTYLEMGLITWNQPSDSPESSPGALPSAPSVVTDSLTPQSSARTRICFAVMGCRHIAWFACKHQHHSQQETKRSQIPSSWPAQPQ